MAWIATALLILAIAYDLRADVRRMISARNVVLFGIFAWYLLEALQAGPAVMAYGESAYRYGVLLVLLAAACFLAGYHTIEADWFDGWGRRVAQLRNWDFCCQTLVVGAMIGAIPVVLYGLADPAETLRGLLAARHGWRGTLVRPALGDFRASVIMLENFLLGVAWIAMLMLGDRHRTRAMTLVAAPILAWNLIRSYGTGTRWLTFVSLLIPVAWYYWRSSVDRQRKLLVAVIPCGLLFYWLLAAMVAGRDEGRLAFDARPDYVGHEMFRELLFAIDEVPERRPYLWGQTLYVEAVNPIPRFIWEDKPVGFGVTYAQWKGESPLSGGPTLSPGIIGEMYINFGVAGIIFLSLLGGGVCRAWDRLGPARTDSLPVLLFYSLGLGCFLMLGRSFSIHLFYQLFASLICMLLVSWRRRYAAGGLGHRQRWYA